MSDLIPYNGGRGEITRRDARRVERSIAQSRIGTELRIARTFDAEDVAFSKLSAMSTAAAAAAGNASRLGRLVQNLEMDNPAAADKLSVIAAFHIEFMLQQLGQLEHELRRI